MRRASSLEVRRAELEPRAANRSRGSSSRPHKATCSGGKRRVYTTHQQVRAPRPGAGHMPPARAPGAALTQRRRQSNKRDPAWRAHHKPSATASRTPREMQAAHTAATAPGARLREHAPYIARVRLARHAGPRRSTSWRAQLRRSVRAETAAGDVMVSTLERERASWAVAVQAAHVHIARPRTSFYGAAVLSPAAPSAASAHRTTPVHPVSVRSALRQLRGGRVCAAVRAATRTPNG